MSQRSAVPVIAGTTLLGGIVFYFSRPTNKSPEEQRRTRIESKRGEGLSGAGVGQTATTGGHETGQPGSGVGNAQTDPARNPKTTASHDQLPSGGVGGGVGAGGANARAIEVTGNTPPGTSSQTGASGFLGGLFGTGGASSGTGTDPETKDTRVASNYAGTPTKRHADWHDQHQPRVPRGDTDNSGDGGKQQQQSSGSNVSQSLQGAFGQGGQKTLHPDDESHGFRNTKVASNHTETATKRA